MEKQLIEERLQTPLIDDVDVVVAGGGVSGVIAAVSAARQGASTVLIERNSFLGGVATANMMQKVCDLNHLDGIGLELMQRLQQCGGASDWSLQNPDKQSHPYDAIVVDIELYKECAMDLCLEAGVTLLLYTTVCAPIMQGTHVTGVAVENKSGRGIIRGRVVIDCTGDGDLIHRAGGEVMVGRESDQIMRPAALLFRVGGLNVPRMLNYMSQNPDQWQEQYRNIPSQKMDGNEIIMRLSGYYDLVEQAKKAGDLEDWVHYLRFEAVQVERGIALCNNTRLYRMDGANANDLTNAEIVGRKQMRHLLAFMKKYIPGCEKAYVADAAATLGVRETRRIKGAYYFSDTDALSGASFTDTVLVGKKVMPTTGNLLADVHPPEPIEGSEQDLMQRNPSKALAKEITYNLPYRILVPKELDNVLVSGRLMSVSHLVEAYSRAMSFCMSLGQVSGTAAALCAITGIKPIDLPFAQLRDALLSSGYSRLLSEW